jgi:hypothetical protein
LQDAVTCEPASIANGALSGVTASNGPFFIESLRCISVIPMNYLYFYVAKTTSPHKMYGM